MSLAYVRIGKYNKLTGQVEGQETEGKVRHTEKDQRATTTAMEPASD